MRNAIETFFENLIAHEHPTVDGRWMRVKGYGIYEVNELTHCVRRPPFVSHWKDGTVHVKHAIKLAQVDVHKYPPGTYRLLGDDGRYKYVQIQQILMRGFAEAGMLQ